MGYALPSGVVNTESAFYYPDTTFKLGPLVKEPADQVLVIIDYSQITPAMAITSFDFAIDVSSNPKLVLSYPQVNAMANVLTFLLSGGIVGQQYNITVRVYSNNVARIDTLTVNTPSFEDCACAPINPVPEIYNELPLGTHGYVNSGVRYFWGVPPANPNVMDQWYDPAAATLYEWVTNGTDFFWELMSTKGVVLEAPSSNIMYSRYNQAWIPNAIQSDAPTNGLPYARFMSGWAPIPPIIPDAPADNNYYARRNNAWESDPSSSLPSTTPPLMDGIVSVGVDPNFARGDHRHPTDTSLYPASNPAGFTTAAQVAAALSSYALITSVPVPSNADPIMNGAASGGGSPAYSRADHRHPSDTSRLALAGGTMTGTLVLVGNPVGNLDAAPKQYVDTSVSNGSIDCGTF